MRSIPRKASAILSLSTVICIGSAAAGASPESSGALCAQRLENPSSRSVEGLQAAAESLSEEDIAESVMPTDPMPWQSGLALQDTGFGCSPGVLQCGTSCCNAYPKGVCCDKGGCAPSAKACPAAASPSGCAIAPSALRRWPGLEALCTFLLGWAIVRRVRARAKAMQQTPAE